MDSVEDDERAGSPSQNITVMGHPPYSPDLVLCDFSLFPTIKSCLKGTHFTSVEVVPAKKENFMKGLPETSFQNYRQKWQHRMQKIINN
ncbi:hypothetical protein TNCV_2336871 [Trichonephila clavipes]|nr:hypothetical protein TNCV_2336871 [Trichonephila clavipes]